MTINLLGKPGETISKGSLRNVAKKRQAIIARNKRREAQEAINAVRARIAAKEAAAAKKTAVRSPVNPRFGDPDWDGAWAERRHELEKAIDDINLDEATKAELLNGQEAAKALGAQGDMVHKGIEEGIEAGLGDPQLASNHAQARERWANRGVIRNACTTGSGFLPIGETKLPIKWHRVGACTFAAMVVVAGLKKGWANWTSEDALDFSEKLINDLKGTQCRDTLSGGKFGPWRECTEEEAAKKAAEVQGTPYVSEDVKQAQIRHEQAVEAFIAQRRLCSKGVQNQKVIDRCMQKNGQPLTKPVYKPPIDQKEVGEPFGLPPEEDDE